MQKYSNASKECKSMQEYANACKPMQIYVKVLIVHTSKKGHTLTLQVHKKCIQLNKITYTYMKQVFLKVF